MKITLDNETLDALDMKSIESKITTYHDYFTLPAGQDISKYGHITGTGAIFFGDEIQLVEA